MPDDRAAERLRPLLWLALAAVGLWVINRLSPILSPFLFATILAYICSPAVAALARRRVPRALGSMIMLLFAGIVLACLVLVLVPLVQGQIVRIAARAPILIDQFNTQISPWLLRNLHIDIRLDPAGLSRFADEHRAQLEALATSVFNSVTSNTRAIVGIVASLFLIPVVMFYLLVDWDGIVAHIAGLMPPRWRDTARRLTGEIDSVLSHFLRGQLLVMLILAGYYSVALWLAGLDFALPVGLLTGLLIFIPYVGFGLGLLLALLTAVLQAQGASPVIGVLVVYGVGQVLEGFVLTPFLVGEKIGLHPVAVIFALLAFGQLFGFFGVLLALPASAALLVGLRALRERYMTSDFYLRP